MSNKPRSVLAGVVAGLLSGGAAQANPTGGVVAHGQASLARPAAGILNIANSPGAIINWQGFSIERGELTRGLPTSYAAKPLQSMIAPGAEPIPVWPSADGAARGIAFAPLYKTAPFAAPRDARFYELLALADALRSGRPRERKLAEQALSKRLQTTQ